jgi:alpha/beta superfamily hydrolase
MVKFTAPANQWIRHNTMPEVIFNGPDGRLEGRYQHGKQANAPIALLLHPQPQHGGTMNNKVVYAMYHAFVRRGFSTLRFNFRGVGRSQGRFDNGQGELSDAAAALDWMQSFNPNAASCWVGGFSFGAWIGMQLLMRRPEIDGFVSVAPPANVYDFTFLAPCPSSGLIVHGTQDDLVPEASVAKLAAKLSSQRNITVNYRTIAGANHSFGTKLDELNLALDDYLGSVSLERTFAAAG